MEAQRTERRRIIAIRRSSCVADTISEWCCIPG